MNFKAVTIKRSFMYTYNFFSLIYYSVPVHTEIKHTTTTTKKLRKQKKLKYSIFSVCCQDSGCSYACAFKTEKMEREKKSTK